MRLLTAIIPFLFLLAAAAGCSRHEALDRAEALMFIQPDSSLAILRAIDGAALTGELRARYALLLSQALDRKGIYVEDDSVISDAYSYYTAKDGGDPHRRMMAYYYMGTVKYNMGSYSDAIYNFTLADTLAARLGDYRFRGLSNSMMGFAVKAMGDYDRELEYSIKALGFFRHTDDSANTKTLFRNVGICFSQIRQYDSAMVYLRQQNPEECYLHMASTLVNIDSLDEFLALQARYPEIKTSSIIQNNYGLRLALDGRLDEAAAVLDSAHTLIRSYADSIDWVWSHSALMNLSGDREAYIRDLETLLRDRLKKHEELRGAYIPSALSAANGFIALSDIQAERHRREVLRLWIIIIILAAALAAVAAVWAVRQLRRRHRRLIESRDKSISRLRRERADGRKIIRKLESDKEILTQRVSEVTARSRADEPDDCLTDTEYILDLREKLASICEEASRLPSSAPRRRRAELRKQLDSCLGADFADRINRIINDCHDNLMVDAQVAGLTPAELQLMRFIACGFTNRQIAMILDITQTALSTRRSRLRLRLRQAGLDISDCPQLVL